MTNLSNARIGSTAQTPGARSSDPNPRVGLEPLTLNHSSPTRYHCAMNEENIRKLCC